MPQAYLLPKKVLEAVPAVGYWLEATVFRGLFFALRLLPLAAACRLAGALFGFFGPRTGKLKKARENLAVAFPDQPAAWREATSREIFRYLGVSTTELLKLDDIWKQRQERLEFELEPGARACIEDKRPVIYVLAHVGPWQVTSFIAKQFNLDISIVYAAESNPILRELMYRARESFGVGLIASDAGARPLLKELASGRSIGLTMDTRINSGKLLPFFGRDALSSTAAAKLSLKTGVEILPICAERLPDYRYRIRVYDPLQLSDPAAASEEQAADLTTQINGHFERWIRRCPEQWICLKRRWPKANKL